MRGGQKRVDAFRRQLAEASIADQPADPAARVRAIRAAKELKLSLGLDPELTLEELDLILPPVECARTRERLGKQIEGETDGPR